MGKSLCLRLRLDRTTWRFLCEQAQTRAILLKAAGRRGFPTPEDQALEAIVGALRLQLVPVSLDPPRRLLLVVRLPPELAAAVRLQARSLDLATAEVAARLVVAHCRFMTQLMGITL